MIYIDNEQEKILWEREYESLIENVINYTLKEEKVENKTQLSVLLVDDIEIQNLNRTYRNIDKATDVLSFPLLDYAEGKVFKDLYCNYDFDESFMDGDELVLGDIVVSLERTESQSKEYGHSFQRELCYLIVHSVLHLLGYDHMEEQDKVKMRQREEHILSMLEIYR